MLLLFGSRRLRISLLLAFGVTCVFYLHHRLDTSVSEYRVLRPFVNLANRAPELVFLTFEPATRPTSSEVQEAISILDNSTNEDAASDEKNPVTSKKQAICPIPNLDPFDASVLRFFRPKPKLVCHKVEPNLFSFSGLKFSWNSTEFALYFTNTASTDIHCRYRNCSFRPHDRSPGYGAWQSFNHSEPLTPGTDVNEIECKLHKKTIFERTFLHVVPNTTLQTQAEDKRPSVLLVMVDALSRSNFVRQLPETFKYLTEDLQAFDFKRQLKVGDNTEPNLFALLTGMLPDSAFPNQKGPYDDWPFIDHYLRDNGYITSMIEDWDVGSLFVQYGGQGFMKPHLTHYPRPFWLSFWDSQLHKNSSQFCYNDMPYFGYSFNYARELWSLYPQIPKYFLVMMEKLTHDDFNAGSQGDAHFRDFLETMRPHLGNTFLFFFSDHGIRYHAIRSSTVGRYESSLPSLFIVPPDNFRRDHPGLISILRENTDRGITTTYEMHHTVRHIASNFRTYSRPNGTFGYSLFEPVPERSCAEAGVPNAFCVCQSIKEAQRNQTWVESAANAILHKVAEILEPFPDCVVLKLKSVNKVLIKTPESTNMSAAPKPGLDFSSAVLTLTVLPSEGILEADVVYHSSVKLFSVDGPIARISMYGNQPHCITDDLARMYCYCKDLLAAPSGRRK